MAVPMTWLTDPNPEAVYRCGRCAQDVPLVGYRLLYRGTRRPLRCRSCEAATASAAMARYYAKRFEPMAEMVDPITHAAALASRHRAELGYVMRRSLERAYAREELYVSTHAMAYVWHRRDGQTTIHAIVSEAPGEGSALLTRVAANCRARGQQFLLAKCPADLPANTWYRRRGFSLLANEPGRHRRLNIWALELR